jgi:phosphoenolpyruvate-protein phosphotransferase
MSEKKRNLILKGKTLSPGLGKGRIFVYRDILTRMDEFFDIEDAQVEEEAQRFIRAVDKVSDDLNTLAGRVRNEMDTELSDVFHAHAAIVQDTSLQTEVLNEIRKELVSAGTAVRTVFRRWERRFRSMEAGIAAQKADDIQDLARRLVSSLAGIRAHALEGIPVGTVLVANRLLPSDTIFLARRNASAAILEVAGQGSHAALFAHEIGLPCVSGIAKVLELASPGEHALVDAEAAEVIINPNQEQDELFQSKRRRRDRASRKAQSLAHEPATTKDGRVAAVFANVGGVEDTREAMKNGAEGIGLYRIEQAYLSRQEPPDKAELLEEIWATLEPAKGLPVFVRLLDIGADKPLPYMESAREANPSLGRRGVRFLLDYPDLLQTQLYALLQLSSDFDLHVIVPMVTLPLDMQRVKDLLTDCAARAGALRMPQLGAMIETPAAALAAAGIAENADFLCFGTNDLTQYTFAADRENASVDSYYDDTQDVIFRLLKTVRDDAPHTPLSICGELAGRLEYASRIMECGISTFSVAPPAIPAIKEAIRHSGSVV